MDQVILLLSNNWLLLAVVFSLFWGIRSTFLFTTDPTQRLPSGQKDLFFLRQRYPCLGIFFIGSYQFLFNFIGSFAGRCCFYVLLSRLQGQALSTHDFTGGDVILFATSIFGLTGHLPQVTYGLVQAVESLAEKAISKMTGA